MTLQPPPQIHVGTPEFLEPTLLLIGDGAAYLWLANELNARREIVLGQQSSGARRATLRIVPDDTRHVFSRAGAEFSWRILASDAAKVARQLVALAGNPSPAHAYLDPELNLADVQVVASFGEYDPSLVF